MTPVIRAPSPVWTPSEPPSSDFWQSPSSDPRRSISDRVPRSSVEPASGPATDNRPPRGGYRPRMRTRPAVLVAGLGTLIVVAFGTVLYGFSVYATDEAAGSVFSTSVLSLGLSGATVVNGLLAPAVGRFADRRGVRGAIALGAVLLFMGLWGFSTARENWHVITSWWLLLGPATALVYYDPAIIALNQWVPVADRPRAFGMLTVVGGMSATIFIPLAGWLVESLGWRPAVRVLAGLGLVVGLAVSRFVVPSGIPSDHPPAARHATLVALVRDRRWVLFTAAVVIVQAGTSAIIALRVDRFTEVGFALGTVTALAGAASLVSLPGRLWGPIAAARWSGTGVFALVLGVIALSAVLAAVPAGTGLMVAHFTVFGLAFGAFTAVRAVVMSGWYSVERFGAVNGSQSAVALVLGGLGPLAVGVGRDVTGGYPGPLAVLAVALVLGAVLSVASGRVHSDG